MRVFPSNVSAAVTKIGLLMVVSMLFALSSIAQTQSTAADLTGTVTDPTGAVVAGAARPPGGGLLRQPYDHGCLP